MELDRINNLYYQARELRDQASSISQQILNINKDIDKADKSQLVDKFINMYKNLYQALQIIGKSLDQYEKALELLPDEFADISDEKAKHLWLDLRLGYAVCNHVKAIIVKAGLDRYDLMMSTPDIPELYQKAASSLSDIRVDELLSHAILSMKMVNENEIRSECVEENQKVYDMLVAMVE